MPKTLFFLLILSLSFAGNTHFFSGQIISAGQWDNYGHTVFLRTAKQEYSAVTAVNGGFRFSGLEAGKYTLNISDKNNVELLEKIIEIPAGKFLYKDAGQKADTLSFVVLNMLLTALIFGVALLLWRRRQTSGFRRIFYLAGSFVLYTATDFLQNILAWYGLEVLAGNIFFLKHIGSAWFGYLFYRFWQTTENNSVGRNRLWLLPLVESFILCTWPFFGLDSAFENFWFFSFAQLRLVILVQFVLFLCAGFLTVAVRLRTEKDILQKNIWTVTLSVLGLLLLLFLGLVLLPLFWQQGTEFFDQQYILTALIFGVILFGWLASTEIYRQILRTQIQLERQERLSALGTLSAGLAHEIKNPLAAIHNLISLLPANYRKNKFRQEFMDIVPRQIERINSLLTDLLEFGRPAGGNKRVVDLAQLLQRVEVLLQAQARRQNVKIISKLTPNLKFRCDARRLEQAFLNLSLNALQSMPGGGRLTISLLKQKQRTCVIFQDTGRGIAPEVLAHIFEPFFTTKKTGTGLGMSITKKILDEHKIKIEVNSQQKRGTEIKLFF